MCESEEAGGKWLGRSEHGRGEVFIIIFRFVSVYQHFACMYVCTPLACMYGHQLPAQHPWRSEEAPQPLDLELWIVVNMWELGTKSGRAESVLNHGGISPSLGKRYAVLGPGCSARMAG